MNRNELMLTGIIAAAGAIISGLVVHYLTREPEAKKIEKVVYEVNEAATFQGTAGDISFTSIKISNDGGVAAKRLAVSLGLKDGEIKELVVNASKGSQETSRSVDPHKARIVFESLLPKESISLSLLLTKKDRPSIDVRSDASLAEEKPVIGAKGPVYKDPLQLISILFVGLSTLMGALSARLVRTREKRRQEGRFREIYGRPRSGMSNGSLNDTGFVLLHGGLREEATKILQQAVFSGDAPTHSIPNYAACIALSGDIGTARQLLDSTRLWLQSPMDEAIFHFNYAIVSIQEKNEAEILRHLTKAKMLAEERVIRWCGKSVIFSELLKDPKFSSLLKYESRWPRTNENIPLVRP